MFCGRIRAGKFGCLGLAWTQLRGRLECSNSRGPPDRQDLLIHDHPTPHQLLRDVFKTAVESQYKLR